MTFNPNSDAAKSFVSTNTSTITSTSAALNLVLPATGDAAFDVTVTSNTQISIVGGAFNTLRRISVRLRQGAGGPYTVTYSSNIYSAAGNAIPNLTQTLGAMDTGVFETWDSLYFELVAYRANVLAIGKTISLPAPPQKPDAPINFTVTPGNGQNVLTWTDGNSYGLPILGRPLYRSTVSGAETSIGEILTAPPYTDTATNGTTYYYKLAARNLLGIGNKTAEKSATPTASTTSTTPTPTGPFPLTFMGAAGSNPTGNSHMIVRSGSPKVPTLDGNGGLVMQAQQTYGLFDTIGPQGDGLYTINVQPGSYRYGQFFFHVSADQSNQYWVTFNPSGSSVGFEQIENGSYSNKGTFVYYSNNPATQPVTASGGSIGVVINGNVITPLIDGALPPVSVGANSYTTDGALTGSGLIGVGIYDAGGQSVVYTGINYTPINQVPVALGGNYSGPQSGNTSNTGSTGSTGATGSTGSSGSTVANTVQILNASTSSVPSIGAGIFANTNALLNGSGTIAVPINASGTFACGIFMQSANPSNNYPLDFEIYSDSGMSVNRTGLVVNPDGTVNLNVNGTYGARQNNITNNTSRYVSYACDATKQKAFLFVDGIQIYSTNYTPITTGTLYVIIAASNSILSDAVIYNGLGPMTGSSFTPPTARLTTNNTMAAHFLLDASSFNGTVTTVAPPLPPATTDNLADGIYFPNNIYVNPNHNGYPLLGTGVARGLAGPYTVACSGLPAAVYIEEDGYSGIALQSNDGTPTGSYPCTWTVSDGTKTLTKNFNIIVNATNAIELAGNYALDTPNYSFTSGAYRIAPYQLENAASDITITDPGGFFAEETFGGYLDVKVQSQIRANFGEHDCAMSFKSNDGSTYTQNTQIFFVHEFNPLVKVNFPSNIYSSLPIGGVFATIAVRAESGVASVAISGASDNFSVSLNTSNTLATLKITTLLVTGSAKPLTVTVTSKSGLVTTVQAPYTVQAGTILNPSNMSFPYATTLNNYVLSQVIGTPSVTNMTGPISWSFTNNDNVEVIYGGANSLFTMADNTTGKLVASGMLPARTEGHLITLSATNGPVTCTASFTVPVAWYANSTVYHVGRGMAAAHQGTGFEHISDITPHLGANYNPCDPAFAGSTIIIHPDSDPNYYANDYGGYEMRGGISGPLRITSPDPNGPLVRVGGTIGSANGGFNPNGDKAFFLFNNGDIYLNGFEISWVNGNGSPDTDYSHGRSAIRKQADVYGDIEITNCWVHDTNNGILTGEGPMKNYIHHNRFSNCGGQTDSGGQTHGCYLDGSHVIYDHNTSDNHMVGHCLKVRAPIAEITNSILMDGENGSASNQINLPQGGNHLVQNNIIHKGPNPQNPYMVSTGEDTINPSSCNDRILVLHVTGNTFVAGGVSGLDAGVPFAVQHFQSISGLDGSLSQVIADQNSFALYSGASKIHTQNFYPANQNTWTETNSTTLADPPVLTPTWFGTASPAPTAPGFFNFPFYYGGGGFNNYYGVQIKSDSEDIHVSTATTGVLTTLRASGANFYASDNVTNDIRLNPFVAGTTWQITQDQEYFPGTNWAPVGRYQVIPSSDGTNATLNVGSSGLSNARGYDVIKVRATAPNGTIADKRFYIVITP